MRRHRTAPAQARPSRAEVRTPRPAAPTRHGTGMHEPQRPRAAPDPERPAMTTAFVLSGGGSLGAVQVGMLQALAERRVTPDLLVGTSAGALNATFVAAHGAGPAALDRLAGIWAALRRDDVFPVRAPHVLLALTGARD